MKVILLKTVQKVGKKDEIVEVADGFAQHSLLPKKLAIPATQKAIAALALQHATAQTQKQIRHQLLDATIAQLTESHLRMPVKANEIGNLFSKVHPRDIVEFLAKNHRITINEDSLKIPEIKKVGTYTLRVHEEDYQSQFTIEFIT